MFLRRRGCLNVCMRRRGCLNVCMWRRGCLNVCMWRRGCLNVFLRRRGCLCFCGLHLRDAWSRQWRVSVQDSTEVTVCNPYKSGSRQDEFQLKRKNALEDIAKC